MTRIVIPLDTDERRALSLLAASELRDPRLQVRYILRNELERRGLLEPQPIPELPTLPKPRKSAKRIPQRKTEKAL